MSAKQKIEAAAQQNGWSASEAVYGRGYRKHALDGQQEIYVKYDRLGRVYSASWAGSTFEGDSLADRVIDCLANL